MINLTKNMKKLKTEKQKRLPKVTTERSSKQQMLKNQYTQHVKIFNNVIDEAKIRFNAIRVEIN